MTRIWYHNKTDVMILIECYPSYYLISTDGYSWFPHEMPARFDNYTYIGEL